MTGNLPKYLLLFLSVACLAGLSGCNYHQIKAERDELWNQNQELQTKLTDTMAALDSAENEAASLRNRPAPAPVVIQESTGSGANRFANIEGVETYQRGGDLHVRVPGDVLFSSGKVTLKSSAKKTLGEIAGVLQSDYASNKIRVEGYTDTDPIRRSKWKDNLELSLQRAAAVHRYLQTQGISADRMYAAGFGETEPAESKARSRRVEIVVVE